MSDKNTKASSTAALKHKLHEQSDDDSNEQDAGLLEHPSYEELQQQLTAAEEKATQSFERMLRLQADMENMQRRVERDISNAHKYALEKFVLELLPIVDGLERAVAAHSEDESGSGTLLDGVNLTLKMLYAAFEKFGIKQVNPEAEAFNPELHQAVSTQPDTTVAPGTVLSVLQKGYLLNNRLIRPALVVVAKS